MTLRRTLIFTVFSLVLQARLLAGAACVKLDWNCFDSTVAIVGRSAEGKVVSFCSGVAISQRQVLTAGHCAVSLSKPKISKIDVYLDANVDFTASPAAQGLVGRLRLNQLYDRNTSFYFHDRGLIELDRGLPSKLNYPIIASFVGGRTERLVHEALKSGVVLERIGFGGRDALPVDSIAGGAKPVREHRRTWLKPTLVSVLVDVLETADPDPTPGDSGGPLFLFLPQTGLVLVGLHSTWNRTVQHVFSPRVF